MRVQSGYRVGRKEEKCYGEKLGGTSEKLFSSFNERESLVYKKDAILINFFGRFLSFKKEDNETLE